MKEKGCMYMWKKVLIALLALVGTFSVVYAMNREFQAVNISANSHIGGDVVGRINIQPTGLNNAKSGFQKGDRFYSDTINPYTSRNMEWMIFREFTYTNYENSVCTPTLNIDCTNAAITAFLAFSEQSIGSSSFGTTNFVNGPIGNYIKTSEYSSSLIASKMNTLNTKLGVFDKKVLAPRNMDENKNIINYALKNGSASTSNAVIAADRLYASMLKGTTEIGSQFFTPALDEFAYMLGAFIPPNGSYTLPFSNKDITFSETYTT